MTMLTHSAKNHAYQIGFSFQKSTQKNAIMNVIFDLNGVLFDTVTRFSENYPQGAQFLSPINPGTTIRLLRDCKKQGHRLFIVSNMQPEHINLLKQNPHASPIFKYFEDIILGPVVGIKKPDPRIFTHLLHKHNLSPDHSIFIDDQTINLKAAEQAGIFKGIQCINFNFAELRSQLQAYGAL